MALAPVCRPSGDTSLFAGHFHVQYIIVLSFFCSENVVCMLGLTSKEGCQELCPVPGGPAIVLCSLLNSGKEGFHICCHLSSLSSAVIFERSHSASCSGSGKGTAASWMLRIEASSCATVWRFWMKFHSVLLQTNFQKVPHDWVNGLACGICVAAFPTTLKSMVWGVTHRLWHKGRGRCRDSQSHPCLETACAVTVRRPSTWGDQSRSWATLTATGKSGPFDLCLATLTHNLFLPNHSFAVFALCFDS